MVHIGITSGGVVLIVICFLQAALTLQHINLVFPGIWFHESPWLSTCTHCCNNVIVYDPPPHTHTHTHAHTHTHTHTHTYALGLTELPAEEGKAYHCNFNQ